MIPRRGHPGPRRDRRAFLGGLLAAAASLAIPARIRSQPVDALRLLKVRHCTFLLELGPVRALVDPWFGRAFGGPLVMEAPPPALLPEDVGRTDLLLVTQGTPDHLDLFGVRRLSGRDAHCFVPDARAASRLRSAGFHRVRQVRPGDRWEVRGITVDVSPGRRDALGPGVGYRLSRAGRTVWAAGTPPPLDVDDAPGRWAREHPAEVVIAGWDAGFGHALGLGLSPEDAILLARLARARFVVPAGDELTPAPLPAAMLSLVAGAPSGPARAPPGGPRLVLAERGLWYRVTQPSGRGSAAGRHRREEVLG